MVRGGAWRASGNAITTCYITVGGGTKTTLVDNNRILVGRLKHSCNEHKLSNGYIGTLNPKRLLTFTVSIKNQDGNDVDSNSPDNNVFRVGFQWNSIVWMYGIGCAK